MEEALGPLVRIEVVKLIRLADKFAGIEVHVPVGAKYVKLNYSSDNFIEILRKLQQKDVTEVYIKQSDCKLLVEVAQASMSAQTFYDPKTVPEQRVESMSNALEVVKNIINHMYYIFFNISVFF